MLQANKPIIIIGAARSGTTLLGEILSQHSKLGFWLEPKYTWRYGSPGVKDDIRTAEDCTPKVEKYIKARFIKFLKQQKKERLLEKTPSNCFRIDFINKLYPEAQFIHLIRDGRKVAISAEIKWTSTPDKTTILNRFLNLEIPIQEWPHYSLAILRDVFGRLIFPQKGYIWGPHFPGIREFRKKHGVIKTCAEQWRQSVNYAIDQFRKIPAHRVKTIYYEDLCSNPVKIISDILDFTELEHENIPNFAEQFANANQKKYSEMEIRKMQDVTPLIKEELKLLGYEAGE